MLLAEFARLRRLSAPDLAREQEAARQAFNQKRSDAARIQLAMALTVPGGAGERRSACAGAARTDRRRIPGAHCTGSRFSSAYIQEQRRLAAQLQALQQNNAGLQQNVQALQQNVRACNRSSTHCERSSAA